MSDTISPERERLDNLLADRALFGVSPAEQAEIDSLIAVFPRTDEACFDRIAASVDLALSSGRFEPMPASLRAAVQSQAIHYFAQRERSDKVRRVAPHSNAFPAPARVGARESLAWILAISAIAAVLLLWSYSGPADRQAPSMAELRSQAIRDAVELVRADWQATGDPAAEAGAGDVVWDNATQRGYMRFRGLAKNDATECQYQLWIFDAERDDKYPIDGGVFDIDVERGEVIVPIEAKLKVGRPAMFAITVEQPGGVVVSDRERICLLAKLDG